ncbi:MULTISPECIES: type II toxin-antitoxin system Phd/YefM family antitoxin [Sphingomonas]|uniref:Antitoxin n=1 Tax=Sphingomonas turrisvirgatae TaxID=1888892 RepID=A0A1E3LUA4_9SPHN|nr:type II toxin-antitoxin system prevent-host-death family antitoxin [Sphingomonas turrisvirgatae]ODP36400.1 prevent-host-death protein [Sphingomonas turrisvirgatae]
MQVPLSDAESQLTELVRRTEAGDDVILTRHGQAVVQLVPVSKARSEMARRDLIEAVRRSGGAKAIPGPDAAHSQDFLYG